MSRIKDAILSGEDMIGVMLDQMARAPLLAQAQDVRQRVIGATEALVAVGLMEMRRATELQISAAALIHQLRARSELHLQEQHNDEVGGVEF